MQKFVIQGGNPLKGVINLGGAKNAGFKLMIASLLMQGETVLLNITPIGDVQVVIDMIKHLGGSVTKHGDKNYFINVDQMKGYEIPSEHGEKSRASLLFAGPLLSRFKKACIPFPGGDRIGTSRDLDRHFDGMKKFGINLEVQGSNIQLTTDKLVACDYTFAKPSHNATENLLMIAVLAEGTTTLRNCALEPEVDDMIHFLNKSGARIKRLPDRVIQVEGVAKLNGVVHKVIPDRNQAVTYALAGILTKGDIIIEDANHLHLETFLKKLDEANAGYQIGEYGIRFFYKGPLKPTEMKTGPHPEFMTDWQPLWATLMTQAQGRSTIVETIYDNRFQYVETLNKIGSDISYFDPNPSDPHSYYYFNVKENKKYESQGIVIKGPCQFHPFKEAVWDVRFGATLLLSALITDGTSELTEIHHIDRGYDRIDEKLNLLGASIQRV